MTSASVSTPQGTATTCPAPHHRCQGDTCSGVLSGRSHKKTHLSSSTRILSNRSSQEAPNFASDVTAATNLKKTLNFVIHVHVHVSIHVEALQDEQTCVQTTPISSAPYLLSQSASPVGHDCR